MLHARDVSLWLPANYVALWRDRWLVVALPNEREIQARSLENEPIPDTQPPTLAAPGLWVVRTVRLKPIPQVIGQTIVGEGDVPRFIGGVVNHE